MLMNTAHAKKTYRIAAGIALLAIVVLAVLIGTKHLRLQSPVVFLSQPQRAVTTSESIAEGSTGSDSFDRLQEISGGNATQEASYQQALEIYKGHIMQLDQNCRAMPVIMTQPIKSVVMLDNRSPWQRTVIVGPRTYSIAPFDYLLVSFNMPGEFAVTCDSFQNTSIISIQ